MIKIRKYKKEDLIACANLTRNTYRDFCFSDGDTAASKRYMDMYDIKKNADQTRRMMEMSKIFFVALMKDEIVGLVRGSKERIRGLYVSSKHHKAGIGKLLVERFEKEAHNQKSKEIKARASLYAIPFYQKMGFKKTTGIRLMGGVKVQPMRKYL